MYKVLIVEDEEIIRKGLIYMTDWASIDCVIVGEAENGVDGLEKVAELHPDIVLLDINMPIKSGLDMLKESKNQYFYNAIILSGYDDFKYAQEAIKFGVTDYLLKPIVPDELVIALEKAKEAVDIHKKYLAIEEHILTPDDINVLDANLWNTINHTSKHVRKMIEYIREHYQEKISIEDLVDELEMSTTYLNKKFKESTNFTFNEFLNRYRIKKAVELIKKGEDKISMIALDVGYSNYRYFIKVFKKYTKLLPSDFMNYYHN